MARMKNSKKPTNRVSKQRRGREEKDNFQDEFADREYEKGYKAGKFGSGKPNYKMQSNDPSWYAKNPKMLSDTASFSYNTGLGVRMRWDQVLANQDISWLGGADTVPGLMSLKIGPTVGYSVDSSSPINIAAQNVYSYVRYKNSGASNYQAPDLMMYLVAMDSLYACWNWMKRIYGTVCMYSQTNRYKPVAYAAANRVDLSDLQSHLADFRAFLNKSAAQISAFCVPATMSFNVRHSWLFSNVYKDGDTNKAQEYMFVPAWFWTFEEVAEETGSSLNAINITMITDINTQPPVLWNFDSLTTLMSTLINNLHYSEDIGIMSGDILKAYGEGNLFHLSPVEPDYSVEAVYSKEVLSQIENATITPINAGKILQDPNTNWIICKPTLVTSRVGVERNGIIINMHMDDPQPADTMVATRLTSLSTMVDGTRYVTAMGSEVLDSVNMFYFTTNGTLSTTDAVTLYNVAGNVSKGLNAPLTLQVVYVDDAYDFSTATVQNDLLGRLAVITMLSHFDWHPRVEILSEVAPGTPNQQTNFVGSLMDWDKYAYLSTMNLDQMHQVALLSEFDIPTNGPTF